MCHYCFIHSPTICLPSQALWLQQGYELEFLGNPTFVPGLWFTSIFFFAVNVWILGIIITDVRQGHNDSSTMQTLAKKIA